MLTGKAPTDSPRIESRAGDTIAVGGVAALDSSLGADRDALAGELNGEIVAVITIRDGVVAANPFRATAAVVDLLRHRRAALLAQPCGA